MKLLFIDSNIFLDFYDFHEEDLDQLGKLVDLIKKGEIKLFLTKQVCNEISKNRETRLREAYKKFDQGNPTIPMPPFIKHYSEYADIKTAQDIILKLKSILNKKLLRDVEKRNLKADKVIRNLIKQSTVIDSDKYLEIAEKRHKFGFPPGKKERSYGDEINWESLLAEVKEEGDFIIIAGDSDYSSLINDRSLKDFLIDEWKKFKKNEIYFYKSLTSFFTEHDIKIQLRIEEEKNTLVNELINSYNFLSTHNTISELGKYTTFTEEQIKGLAQALLENSQVRGIIEDDDVNSFYKKIFTGKSDMFKHDDWRVISQKIFGKEEEVFEGLRSLEKKFSELQKEGDGNGS